MQSLFCGVYKKRKVLVTDHTGFKGSWLAFWLSKMGADVLGYSRATRPWQHVLEPLSGYLLLGQKLLEGKKEFAEAWNFGPNDDGAIPVERMVKQMQKTWNKIDYQIEQDENNPHEAGMLKLDCSKARMRLNWKGAWDSRTTFAKTAEWYQCYYEDQQIITQKQLKEYVADAGKMGLSWVK